MTRLIALAPFLFLASGAQSATVEHGELLVRRNCGVCHAVAQTDDSRNPMAPPLRELNRRYEPDQLAEALAEGILTGHPAMPEFRFAPDEVRSIIIYLNAIQTRQRTELRARPLR